MSNEVALIGAGAMGGAIGTRLLDKGNTLHVFDLDQVKVAELVAKGGIACSSAAGAAKAADFVIFSLNAAHIVRSAAFGKNGAISGAKPGTVFIDMSSIDPDNTKYFAAEAKKAGFAWVDSPLSGGAPRALAGELTLMAGGDKADVYAAHQCLKDVASNYTHMGPSGTGHATKIINQVLCGVGFMAVAEATQLALDAGVDAEKIPIALKNGRADSAILQEYMPRFATKDYRRTGRIDNMVKDLSFAQALALQSGTSMPLTALCMEIHKMLTAAGLGAEDQAALMEYFNGADKNNFS